MMKCIIKLFSEIVIKSDRVRIYFIKVLFKNIKKILCSYSNWMKILYRWDSIELTISDCNLYISIAKKLSNVPGISSILLVQEYSFNNINDIYNFVFKEYSNVLIGKSFCVRAQRRGKHNFTSCDVESYIGGGLLFNICNTKIDLINPEKIIKLEIVNKRVLLVINYFSGIGGFPIGTQGNVISLISGGYDSSVSSYMFIRRGYKVDYCFFNLGGIIHELGVRKLVYYLWKKFSSSHKIRFISLDFSLVISEFLNKSIFSNLDVILKRMMIRAAILVTKRYKKAFSLVTGDSLGQVSSQTLDSIKLIDDVIKNNEALVFRPLIVLDKEYIISLSKKIGTNYLSKLIPEFCDIMGKINKKKNSFSRKKISIEESKFDFSILDTIVRNAQLLDVKYFSSCKNNKITDFIKVRFLDDIEKNDIILDIRSYNEQKNKPLCLFLKDKPNIVIKKISFYNLKRCFSSLNKKETYLLYCNNGVVSYLQANFLYQQGFLKVGILKV